MNSIHPYLNFNGNTEEAFTFYKSVFGGEFSVLQRFKETEFGDKLSETDREKIMHISLPIGDSVVLMATDVLGSIGQNITVGTNFSLSVNTESEAEATRVFNELSAGGTVTMELNKTFWGAYFGMFTDKFGIQWMVNYDYNQPS